MSTIPGTPEKRSLWVRLLLMILMAMAFHLAATLLGVLALVQFVLAIVAGGPNERLQQLGRSLGSYFRQLTNFLSFATEQAPFPFSDWPSGD
jgi:hypothetical protein